MFDLFAISEVQYFDMETLALLRNCHPGRPRSRAKDQVSREDEARTAIVAQKDKIMMIDIMAALPPGDPVA